jgi:phosphatidate cytidylyltransferase
LEKAIASVLCVVWASDTGGYVCGKLIRGPRVFSVLSPRKTYSGYCGALGFAICVGTLVGFNLYQDLLICVVGVIGDLIGSWIKRVKGVKDASSLIPGHGGLLDRFDSVLPLGALLYMIF